MLQLRSIMEEGYIRSACIYQWRTAPHGIHIGVAQWLFNPKEWSEWDGDVAIAAKAAKRARRTERRMKVAT